MRSETQLHLAQRHKMQQQQHKLTFRMPCRPFPRSRCNLFTNIWNSQASSGGMNARRFNDGSASLRPSFDERPHPKRFLNPCQSLDSLASHTAGYIISLCPVFALRQRGALACGTLQDGVAKPWKRVGSCPSEKTRQARQGSRNGRKRPCQEWA